MPPRPIIVAALCAAVLVLVLLPPRAHAGTYDVYSCRLPGGASASSQGWTPFATPGLETGASDSCAGGDGLQAGLPATEVLPGPLQAGWRFDAPDGTAITAFEISRSVVIGGSSDQQSSYTYAMAAGDGGPLSNPDTVYESCWKGNPVFPWCTALGSAGSAEHADNVVARSGVRESRVTVGVGCRHHPDDATKTSICNGGLPNAAGMTIYRSRFTLADEAAPVIESPAVVANDPAQGTLSIAIAANDRGAGINDIALIVDGREVPVEDAVDSATCSEPYVTPVPCPRAVAVVRSVRLEAPFNATHTLQLIGRDAAGNVAQSALVTWAPVAGATNEGTTPALDLGAVTAPRELPRFVRLRSWFAGKSRATVRTLNYGQRATIEGVLTDAAGAVVPSASLRIEERSAGAGVTSTVRTDAKGRFSFRLGTGPSRVVEVSYRAAPGDPAPVAVARVTVRVRAGVTLKTSTNRVRNGSALRFFGRVLGERGSRRAIVTIYALTGGRRARIPVETVRANSEGRFSYTYRFGNIGGPSVYRFEARAPKQTGFPYLEGASPRVTVRGRP